MFLLLVIALAMAGTDLYEVLGLSKKATDVEIKKAYKKKAVHNPPSNSDHHFLKNRSF